jgi:hypothetical protein
MIADRRCGVSGAGGVSKTFAVGEAAAAGPELERMARRQAPPVYPATTLSAHSRLVPKGVGGGGRPPEKHAASRGDGRREEGEE